MFRASAIDSGGRIYVAGDIKGEGTIYRSIDSGSSWSVYSSSPDVKSYHAMIVAKNEFEEYLILGGEHNSDIGVLRAVKVSDNSTQEGTTVTILTGTIWGLAASGSDVFFTFSENYAPGFGLATTRGPVSVSVQNSTASIGRVRLPQADEIRPSFFPIKVNGDTKENTNNPDTSANYKNWFAREVLKKKERDNE